MLPEKSFTLLITRLFLAKNKLILHARGRGHCPTAPFKPAVGQLRWSEIAKVRQYNNKGKHDCEKIKTSNTNDD